MTFFSKLSLSVCVGAVLGFAGPAAANENQIVNITLPCPYPCPTGGGYISRPAGGYLGIEWSGGEPAWTYKFMIVADDDPKVPVTVGGVTLLWDNVKPGKRSWSVTLPEDMPPGFYKVYIEKVSPPITTYYGPIWDYGPSFWVDAKPK